MATNKVRQIADAAFVQMQKTTTETRGDIHWDSISKIITNISAFLSFLIAAVKSVEAVVADNAWTEPVSGDEKLEAAVEVVDAHVELSFWEEIIDGPVFRVTISLVVAALNRFFGKDWLGNEAV